jgi:hypothetical protein
VFALYFAKAGSPADMGLWSVGELFFISPATERHAPALLGILHATRGYPPPAGAAFVAGCRSDPGDVR